MVVIDLVACILIADFISGVIHWAEDTYAVPTRNEFFNDNVVMPNIAHHRNPAAICRGTYWENSYVTTTLAAGFMLAIFLIGIHAWQPYFIACLAAQFNQTHAWAHGGKVPNWVGWLQKTGIMISVGHHIVHHRKPYMVRYCVGTNLLNPILDKIKIWRIMELCLRLVGAKVKRGSKEREGY